MWISRGYIEHLADADAAGLVVGPSLTRTSLNAVIASQVPEASTSIAGRVRLAGVADAVAGTSGSLAVTPAGLAAGLGRSSAIVGPVAVSPGTATIEFERSGPLVVVRFDWSATSPSTMDAGRVMSLPDFAGRTAVIPKAGRPVRFLGMRHEGGAFQGTLRMSLDAGLTEFTLEQGYSATEPWSCSADFAYLAR